MYPYTAENKAYLDIGGARGSPPPNKENADCGGWGLSIRLAVQKGAGKRGLRWCVGDYSESGVVEKNKALPARVLAAMDYLFAGPETKAK